MEDGQLLERSTSLREEDNSPDNTNPLFTMEDRGPTMSTKDLEKEPTLMIFLQDSTPTLALGPPIRSPLQLMESPTTPDLSLEPSFTLEGEPILTQRTANHSTNLSMPSSMSLLEEDSLDLTPIPSPQLWPLDGLTPLFKSTGSELINLDQTPTPTQFQFPLLRSSPLLTLKLPNLLESLLQNLLLLLVPCLLLHPVQSPAEKLLHKLPITILLQTPLPLPTPPLPALPTTTPTLALTAAEVDLAVTMPG